MFQSPAQKLPSANALVSRTRTAPVRLSRNVRTARGRRPCARALLLMAGGGGWMMGCAAAAAAAAVPLASQRRRGRLRRRRQRRPQNGRRLCVVVVVFVIVVVRQVSGGHRTVDDRVVIVGWMVRILARLQHERGTVRRRGGRYRLVVVALAVARARSALDGGVVVAERRPSIVHLVGTFGWRGGIGGLVGDFGDFLGDRKPGVSDREQRGKNKFGII